MREQWFLKFLLLKGVCNDQVLFITKGLLITLKPYISLFLQGGRIMKKRHGFLFIGILTYTFIIGCNKETDTSSKVTGPMTRDTIIDTIKICTDTGKSAVQLIDTLNVSYTINILGNPNGLVINKDGSKAFVTNGSGLLEIDIPGKKMLKNYSLPNSRIEVNDISPDGKMISLSEFTAVYIAPIDKEPLFQKIITGSAVYGSCFSNTSVYAPCFNDRVVRTYRLKDSLEKMIDPYDSSGVVASPNAIGYSSDRKYIIAVDEGNQVLHIINAEKDSALYQIPTGRTAKFTIPIIGDTIAAFLENSKQFLLINLSRPNEVPMMVQVDSLEYAHDAVYSRGLNRMFIVLGRFLYDKDNGLYESSFYYAAQLIVMDMSKFKVLLRKTINIDASNLQKFKIALTPDDNLLLITSSEALHVFETKNLKTN
jgi:hypothetical protein